MNTVRSGEGRPSDLAGAFRSTLRERHDQVKEVIARIRTELAPEHEELEGDELQVHEQRVDEETERALEAPDTDAGRLKDGKPNALTRWAAKKVE